MKALIVDDEEDIGFMVSRLLTREGIEVDYTDRIKTAEKKIEKEDYQLYFLDLNLPDGTGFDLMQQIRLKNVNAKVVIISAYDDLIETSKKENIGDVFIKKPFSTNQVIEAIREST